MKLMTSSYLVGLLCFIFLGIGHLTTHLFVSLSAETIPDIMVEMNTHTVKLAGDRVTIFSLYSGFSLMMGVLFVGLGVFGLFLPTPPEVSSLQFKKGVGALLVISLVSLYLSTRYFFIVPVLFTAASSIAFFISLRSRPPQSEASETD